jgi:aspartate aminotransferase-like enzyme
MAQELPEALENLKKIVFCENGEGFIIAGAGTLAMEMALLNTLAPGEKALILSQGYFGARMAEVGRTFGLDCELLESPWGQAVPPEELERRLAAGDFGVVAATHVDTATGTCAPIREYAEILKKREALYIVDGVCATGGIEERMDDWGIDVILTAAQKCFGAPPGLALLVLSERAMEKRKKMPRVPAYYSDLLRWLPIMKDPAKYFSTPCVNEVRAFCESTRIILEEGLERRFIRHSRTGQAIRSALEALGFTLFTRKEALAATLSVVNYPPGVEDKRFRSLYYENGVVVAGGLAQTAGKVFRMGHMGNLSTSQVYFALDALEQTLQTVGFEFPPGAGRRAAREILGE